MESKFKRGETVFHQYNKYRVIEMDENGKAISVEGHGHRISSLSLENCLMPCNDRIEQISAMYREMRKLINDKMFLNWPDISNFLEQSWLDACREENEAKFTRIVKEAGTFVELVNRGIELILSTKVMGVKLIR